MSNISIRNKVRSGFLLIIIMVFFLSGFIFVSLKSIYSDNDLLSKTNRYLNDENVIITKILMLHHYEKDFFINIGNRKSQKKYLKRFKNGHEIIIKNFKKSRKDKEVLLGRVDSRNDEFLKYLKEYADGFQSTVATIFANPKITTYQANQMLVKYKKNTAMMEKILRDNIAKFRKKIIELEDNVSKVVGNFINGLLTVVVFTIIFSILIAFIIFKAVFSLKKLIKITKLIANGDFTQSLEVKKNDEVGMVANSLNDLVKAFSVEMKELDSNSDKGLTTSNELKDTSQNLIKINEVFSAEVSGISSAATEMSQTQESVASAIEEMSISIKEIAKQAEAVSSRSEHAEATTKEAVKQIEILNENAISINKVINVISSIASQINLLALNAAIEAAGAGEAGKGFAVVASEIKELATQTTGSAVEITESIGQISESIRKRVDEIREVGDVISEIKDSNSSMASAIEEQSITTNEISSSVTQTTIASNSVASSIEGLSNGILEITTISKKVESYSNIMNGISNKLKEITSKFKY